MRCEGYTWEEIDRHTDLVIRVHGYLLMQVADEDRSWTYTIGLVEGWDHPEFLCLDGGLEAQAVLVNALGDEIRRIGHVRPTTAEFLDVRLVEIQESRLHNDRVAAWEDRYERPATTEDFLLVIPGRSWSTGPAK